MRSNAFRFVKSCFRWLARIVLTVGVVSVVAIVGVPYIIQKETICQHITHAMEPLGLTIHAKGPKICLSVWPYPHVRMEHVVVDGSPLVSWGPSNHVHIDQLKINISFASLVQCVAMDSKHPGDVEAELRGIHTPYGGSPATAHIHYKRHAKNRNAITMHAVAPYGLIKGQACFQDGENIHLTGEIQYQKNVAHLIKGVLDSKTLQFEGNVVLIGRKPIVCDTSQPAKLTYDHHSMTCVLHMPTLSTPWVYLSDCYAQLTHHKKMNAWQLEAHSQTCNGHVEVHGKLSGQHTITCHGIAQNVNLAMVKALKDYVRSGFGTLHWNIACDTQNLASFSGVTHLTLQPIVLKGPDLESLQTLLKGTTTINALTTIQNAIGSTPWGWMQLTCHIPIAWKTGVGTLQNGTITTSASGIKAVLSGHVTMETIHAVSSLHWGNTMPPLDVVMDGPWAHPTFKPHVEKWLAQWLHRGVDSAIRRPQQALSKALQHIQKHMHKSVN